MPDEAWCSEIGQFIPGFPGYEVVPNLVRLIASGEPVRIENVAASAACSASAVESTLRDLPGTVWDDDGRMGGAGLTLRQTAHRFIVSARAQDTFGSTEALIFPAILGNSAIAESTRPGTGQAIRIAMAPDAVFSIDLDGAAVSPLLDSCGVKDIRSQDCDQGHCFASVDVAGDWANLYPDGRLLMVSEALQAGERGCEELGLRPRTVVSP